MKERGQALTLEGGIAAVLLVMSLVFALQVSAVTPLTESTSSQHIENQQRAIGQNVLAAAAEDGTLKSTVLFWEPGPEGEDGRYVGAPEGTDGAYTAGVPDEASGEIDAEDHADVLRFGQLLDESFRERGIAYNVHVSYVEDDERKSRRVVTQGQPSNHAVTVTRTVTLYESDTLYSDGETELAEPGAFYAGNENEATAVYNVVEVELVIWRM